MSAAWAYGQIGAGRVRAAGEDTERHRRARSFWFHCEPAAGSPVEPYLTRRGLRHLVGNPWVRFCANAPHPTGVRLPAMIWLVFSATGDIAATHRTFLDLSGAKARVSPPKATFGPI